MVMPPTHGSMPIAQTPAPAPSALPKKSYLVGCVEDLSPDKVSTLDGRWGQSTRWTVATCAACFFYTAGVVCAGVLLPTYSPAVVIISFLGATPVVNRLSGWVDHAKSCIAEANGCRELQKI